MNLLLDWTGFLRQSKGWWSNGGVPHQRETLDRTYRATMNHIKAGTGSPLAAADDGARHVTGMISLVTRPQSCQLYFFYGLAPSTWPHIFYFTSDTHTLSFNSTPPHLPSWLHTHIHTHTHTHTHFFTSPGQWHQRYWAVTGNPYSWQMSALQFDWGRK